MIETTATVPGTSLGRRLSTRLPLLGGVFALLLFGSVGCEDKAIGRVCDLQIDGGSTMNQALVNPQALECPSRVCLRPASQAAESIDTTSLCTAECSKDSDCDGSETRTANNVQDKRCKGGFVCGVASVVGSFCCKKLCMCRDFLPKNTRLETPESCNKSKYPDTCPLVH